MNPTDEGRHIDAMLRHVGCGHDLRDFPGTSTEKLALLRIANTRGLIEWRKTRARYELTHFGWNELLPRRRFGAASLILSAAVGGMVGAAALAVYWLPADASRPSARGHSSASISRVERPNVPRPSRSAEIPARGSAPPSAIGLLQDAVAVATEPDTREVVEADRPDLADRPAAEEPKADAALSGVKEPTVKKARRKTAHHRRREHNRSWAYSDPWRAQGIRYAGYGGQRGWYGDR